MVEQNLDPLFETEQLFTENHPSRVQVFENIDLNAITSLDTKLLSILSSGDIIHSTEAADSKLLEELTFIISHPDEVDFFLVATSLVPHISLPEIQDNYHQWHQQTQNRLVETTPLTPTLIQNHIDLDLYHSAQIPPRAGAFLAAQPDAQSILPLTQQVLYRAVSEALQLAGENESTQLQVIRAIVEGTKTQDKWQVFGIHQGDIYWDPVTDVLLSTLQAKFPELSSLLSLDTLYRRYSQDSTVTAGLNQFGHQIGSGLLGPSIDREHRISQTIQSAIATPLGIEMTQSYVARKLSEHDPDSIMLIDEIVTQPQMRHDDIQIGSERTFSYYDHTYTFTPQLENVHHLAELQFGLHAVFDDHNQVVAFIDTDPRNYEQVSTTTEARVYPIEHVLYRHQPDNYPTTDELTQFSKDYHQVQDQLAKLTGNQHAYLLPPPVIFQYWRYCQSNRENHDKVQAINEFIESSNLFGCLLLSAETGNGATIDAIIDFAQHATPPQIAHNILAAYVDMSTSFWEKSYQMGTNGQDRTAFASLILDRSKSILNLGLQLHQEGTLEAHAESLTHIITIHSLLNLTLQDQAGELARKFKFPLDAVNEVFASLDPNQPDTKRLLGSAINLWMHTTAGAQSSAQYMDQVPELTADFYRLYEQIATDTSRTTVNAEIELPRYQKAIARAIKEGRLSPSQSTKIAYVGIGSGQRLERYLIEEFANQGFQDITHLGIDPFPPEEIPENIEYIPTALEELINHPELKATVDHTYLIASPMMDILELIKMIDATLGLAHISKMGATVSIDEAFPFGANSYQQEIEAMQALDPTAPDTLFERTFTLPDGTEFGKPFLASTPALKHHLMALAGFGTCVNFPTNIKAINYIQELTSQDDGWIINEDYQADTLEHQEWINQAREALYRTHDAKRGYNRITYEYQKTSEPDRQALLELRGQLTAHAQHYLDVQSSTLAETFFAAAPSPAPMHTTA